MEADTTEENSSNMLNVAMRLSPNSSEVTPGGQKTSIESVATTSENLPDKGSFSPVTELTVSSTSQAAEILNKSPEKKLHLTSVDSRTITRPKRPQGVVDVESKQTLSTSPEDFTKKQPIAIIPPAIPTQVQRIENTPVRKIEQPLKTSSELNIREVLQRNEAKVPIHRSRQKTVTVHSQLSLEITNAFKEGKEKSSEDSLIGIQRRVQAFVAAKEKEWASRHEKLSEEIDSWEHKAVERNVLIYEYDKIVKQLVEALKVASRKSASNQSRLSKGLLGGPGPERNISPDEVVLLRKERDQLAEDVMSWETSYDELYKRYEKLRQASLEFKRNAEDTKHAYEELQEQYDEAKKNFEVLRTEAENEINRANLEMEKQEKLRETDTLGLRLKVKHLEAKNSSLSMSLETKMKELADMEALFEDIVHKADSNVVTQ